MGLGLYGTIFQPLGHIVVVDPPVLAHAHTAAGRQFLFAVESFFEVHFLKEFGVDGQGMVNVVGPAGRFEGRLKSLEGSINRMPGSLFGDARKSFDPAFGFVLFIQLFEQHSEPQ